MEMICQECGADNPDSAKFCNLCHNRFDGTSISPAVGSQSGQVFVPGSPGPSDVPQAPLAAQAADFEPAPGAPLPVDVMPPPPPPLMPSFSGFQPPPSSLKKGLFASPLGKVLPLVIMLVFFVLGYYGMGYLMGGGTSTYTSTQSDLSFQYPPGWIKLNASEFSGLTGVAGIALYNEVLLADSTSDNMKYFVGAGSIEMSPEQWEARKVELRRQFGGDSPGVMPQGGVSMTGSTVTDTTIGGAGALDIRFKVTSTGYDFDCRAVLIDLESKMYMLLFMTRGDKSTSAAQVQKVVDSIKFKKPAK